MVNFASFGHGFKTIQFKLKNLNWIEIWVRGKCKNLNWIGFDRKNQKPFLQTKAFSFHFQNFYL